MTILRLLLSLGTLAILFFADVSSSSAAMMLFQEGPATPYISPQRFVQGRSDTASFGVGGRDRDFFPVSACTFNTNSNTCTQSLILVPSTANPRSATITIPPNLSPGTYTIQVTGQDGRTYVVTIEVVRAQLIQWVHGLGEDYAEYWDLYGREFSSDRLADFNFQHYPSSGSWDRADRTRYRYGRQAEYDDNRLFLHPSLQERFNGAVPGIETIGQAIYSFWNKSASFAGTEQPFSSLSPGVSFRGFRYSVSQENRPPIMIGHSMGGIVARSLANSIAANPGLNTNAGQIGGIITVGTPNQGAQIVQSVNDGTADYSVAAAIQHIIAGPSFTFLNLSVLTAGQAALYFKVGSVGTILGGTINAAATPGLFLSGLAGTAVSILPPQRALDALKERMGIPLGNNVITLPSTGIQDMRPNSPLLQSLQSSSVPIISMYGKVSTQNDNPHWRIASTFIQRHRTSNRDILSDLLNFYGYNDVQPQFAKDFSTGSGYKSNEQYDNFVADMTNWTLLPIYWGGTAWSTAVSVANFVGGNVLGGLWHAFGAVQWSRGATYLTWTAKHDWNKLIGAQKIVQRPTLVFRTQPNFPWIWIGNELRDYLEDEDGDGLFGEEAQKYKGTNAIGLYEAEGMSHNMSSNHPKSKQQFERAFDDPNIPFYAPKRR